MLREKKSLKSLGPIHHKYYGHGKNDGFVLYEYVIINNVVVFANKQTSVLWKNMKKNNISTVNRKYVMFMGKT